MIFKAKGTGSEFAKFILKVPIIFKGKTSFIGPQNINSESSLYLGKKGLTGLWYLENPLEGEKEKLDMLYAKNQNIWLDLEILSKTIMKMWDKRK